MAQRLYHAFVIVLLGFFFLILVIMLLPFATHMDLLILHDTSDCCEHGD